MASTKANTGVDMLHGPMAMKILLFALPLMASGILQQSFNAVDIAVVGNYNGPAAIAAVDIATITVFLSKKRRFPLACAG